MYLYLIPLMLGFALVGASAFTAAYSRWWGERGGEIATSVFRNFLGIPLWVFGFITGWLQPAQFLLTGGVGVKTLGWLLIIQDMVNGRRAVEKKLASDIRNKR